MATNSLFGVQPFEELAQEEEPASPTSLEDFYREQERKDLERRISRIRRRRRGSSRASEPETPGNEQPPTQLPPVYQSLPLQQQQQDQQDQPPPQQQGPPQLQLTWQQNRQSGLWWTHESSFKTRYEIHNPTPNPYPWINHHLLPPGTTFPPTTKPPRKSPSNSSNFTPSLPNGLPRVREPSGTTSTSNSSTSTVPRSRSVTNLGTSTLHHDNVDFLDASDPWGMRWHHDGRYDPGGASRAPPLPAWSNGTTSLPGDPNRFKSRPGVRRGAPSPLSQSTSAMQLSLAIAQSNGKLPLARKLSKRHSANAVAATATTPTSERHLFPSAVPEPSKPKTKRGSILRFFGINSSGHSQGSTTNNAFLSAPESSDRRWLDRRRSQTLPSGSDPAAHQHSEKGFQVIRKPTGDAINRHAPQRSSIPPSVSEPHITGVGGGGNGAPLNKDNYLNPPSSNSNSNHGMLSVPQAANSKEKHGSTLGRLVKKLSLVKKDSSNEWERQGGLKLGANEAGKRSSGNVQTQGLESGGKGSRVVTPNDYSVGEDSTSQQHHGQDQRASSRTGPFGSESELGHGHSGQGATSEDPVLSLPQPLFDEQRQSSPTRPIPEPPTQQHQVSKPEIHLQPPLPQDEEQSTPPQTPFRGQELERERERKDSSDGRSSPELQFAGQLGGLMVTNPDHMSDAGSMLGDSPHPVSQQRRNGQLLAAHAPVTLKPGMLSSAETAESSPYTPFVPLRKVTNPDPETETEGGTLRRPNSAITPSRRTTLVDAPPLPEVKRGSIVRQLTQQIERQSEERGRGFKPVQRDPRLLALAEILSPSARKPVPELSVSPANDEDPTLVFTSSPIAEENDDDSTDIKSPKSPSTIDEIMDLSPQPPRAALSPSGMTIVLEGLQSPRAHLQQPNQLEPFADPLDDKPLPAILSRNHSIMSRATSVPPTPPPKSFAQLAKLAAPRLAPTERVPLGTEEISPLPSPRLTSPPARPVRSASRLTPSTSSSREPVQRATSTTVGSKTPTPERQPSTPVIRSSSPQMPSSPSIATIPSPTPWKAPSALPDPAMLAPPSPGTESTLTIPSLSAIPNIPSPAVTYVPVPVYIPVLPPSKPKKSAPKPAPSPNPLPPPPASISLPKNGREDPTRPKITHANSYHAYSSSATAPAAKRPISAEAQFPPHSIAQALEKTPSTVSGYTTAPEALGEARTRSTSAFEPAPVDISVSRGKDKKEKEKIPAHGTEWEVIEAVMMHSPDSPTPPATPASLKPSVSSTPPTAQRDPSNYVRQASTSASGSQWRREGQERLSVNGTSDSRHDSYPSSRQDEYPSRHGSYIAPRLDDYSARQDSYGSNRPPSHSRPASGDIREPRERERAREPNKILRRATAPAPAPVKPSSSPIQEKVRGPEKLIKRKSRRDRELEGDRARELSRQTSQVTPSGPSKSRSRIADTRAEQDLPKAALNSNPSTRRARPTSEVAVDPIEQLKAQGAWEHAKMVGLRGQSMVMPERFSVAPQPHQTMPSHAQGQYQPPAGSPPPQYSHSQHHQNGHPPRATAGSSHTQFVVQPSFQQQTQSQQQQPRAWPAYQYRQYAYYPVQQKQTPVEPNPLPTPPAQINYPSQQVNR